MRFFIAVCCCCMIVATVGCMTKNWSTPLFERGILSKTLQESADEIGDGKVENRQSFWNSRFGEASGIDPRSREIERRLGL